MHCYLDKKLRGWHSRTWLFGAILLLSLPGLISGIGVPPSAAAMTTSVIFLIIFLQKKDQAIKLRGAMLPITLLIYFTCFSLTLLINIRSHPIYADIFTNNLFFSLFVVTSSFLFFLLRPLGQYEDWYGEAVRSALAIIVFTNIFLILLGVENIQIDNFAQTRQANAVLALLGVEQTRIIPPIAGSVQMAAVFPAALLSASLLDFSRASAALMGAAALLLLILIDARGALVAPLLVLFVWRFRRSMSPGKISAIIIFIPIIYPYILYSINNLLWTLSRNDSAGVLSNRDIIWKIGFQNIENMRLGSFLFGDGAFSTYTTGFNVRFSDLFSSHGATTRDFSGMHNTYFQLFLDTGLFGLCAFMAITYFVVRNVLIRSLDGRAGARLHFCMIVSVLFMSATEVLVLPYAKEGAVLFLILLMGGVAAGHPNDEREISDKFPRRWPVLRSHDGVL